MSVNIYNKTLNTLTKIAGNAISSGEPASLEDYYTKEETSDLIANALQDATLSETEVKTIFDKDN